MEVVELPEHIAERVRETIAELDSPSRHHVDDEAQKFGDPDRPWFHPRDLDAALDIDRYDFAIAITREEGRLVARPERP